jgi:hypothetical protein
MFAANKFQKTRFWKEKSVEDMVTLRPTAQATPKKPKFAQEINKNEVVNKLIRTYTLQNYYTNEISKSFLTSILQCLRSVFFIGKKKSQPL